MLSSAALAVPWTARQHGRRPRQPSVRQAIGFALVVAAVITASTVVSTFAYLSLPAVTGSDAVGRVESLLTDPVRMDRQMPSAHRQVRLIAWYAA